MKDNGKIILALLAGAAAGAALGILFAPGKGYEIRKEMIDSAKKMADNIKTKVKEGSDVFSKSGIKENNFEQTKKQRT